MASIVSQNTFLSQYNDDFSDSDHYHRILFNNGRALQARELTQMQTIIQNELSKLAGFVFKEGGIFNTSAGSISAGSNAISFVKVNSLPVGYATLVGTDIESTDGIRATVKAVVPASGSDNNTLLVKYITSNNLTAASTTTPRIFQPSDILAYDTGTIAGNLTVQATNTTNNPATGKGSFIEVPQFNTFVAGHLIMVEQQSLVISKYDPAPDVVVGFKLTEEIITASDDIALYDNSGSTPNLTSPGADRYKITMTLVKQSDVATSETFFPVYELKKGIARAIRSQDNLLAELGSIISGRTDNISGDFIVPRNQFGEFNLEVTQDSDTNYLLYKTSGGVAFVKGNRIERSTQTINRVLKPRDASSDLDTKSNEFVSARYGNYFLGDANTKGLIGDVTTLDKINLYNATNRGGSIIGTARLRNVDEFDNNFRLHVFDLKMDSSGGTPYSVGSVRSVGTSATSFANLVAKDGRYDIYDKDENSLLFTLPRTRVQEITSVTMAIRKIYTDVSDASGTATFSTGSTNTFANPEDWIVAVDSSGELFSPPSVSGTPTTSAVITGLPTSSSVSMLAYENTTAIRKTKTLQTNATETLSMSGNQFNLSKPDIYKFKSVVDDTTSEDITYKFRFDNGQRDDYYTIGSGKLKSGAVAPAGTITVTYDYFTHSAGDFFGGKPSYPDVEYENVPIYTSSRGVQYRLTDVIDMRPIKDNTGSNFTGTGAVIENLPKNTNTITIGTAKYWQPRIDVVALGTDGSVTVYNGSTKEFATTPQNVPSDSLKLHRVNLNPYTTDDRDLIIVRENNRGYKMKDIRTLERRIENLEEAVTITQSELDTIRITVPDPNDSTLPDRVKLGLTADAFASNIQSAVEDVDYRANINRQVRVMRPLSFKRQLPLYYDSDLSTGTILKGSSVWPKYTEEVMIDQSVASKFVNVNQFEITKSVGAGYLDPNIDTWQRRKKVDNTYSPESTSSFIPSGSTTTSSQGEQE